MDKVIVTRSKIVDIADSIRKKGNIKRTMTLEEMARNIQYRLGNSYGGGIERLMYGFGTPTELCGKIEIQ